MQSAPALPAFSVSASQPANIREHNEKTPSPLKGNTGIPGKGKNVKKPPSIIGYEWHRQSTGFVCRRVIVEGKKRRREYIGYLSGPNWQKMQREHSGPSLKTAVQKWIRSKEGRNE